MSFETFEQALARLSHGAETERARVIARRVEQTGAALAAEGWQRLELGAVLGAVTQDFPFLLDRKLGDRWYDHPYMLENAATGAKVLVSEPYGLVPAAIEELASLAADGWSITIGAERSLQIPGETLAIWVTRGTHPNHYVLLDQTR